MTDARQAPFRPERFFVLRTPLLAIEDFTGWSANLTASDAEPAELDEALAKDRALLRGRLRALIERPEVREALFLASPSLFDAIAKWREDPDSKRGRKAETALVRYLTRMCLRATPFGLFSGCSVGRFGVDTQLRFGPRERYSRRTRPDNDYLFSLARALSNSPELEGSLQYRINSSLYRVGEKVRWAECLTRAGSRSYQLISAEIDEFLQAVLDAARPGSNRHDLAAATIAVDDDGEISIQEAETYVSELIDSQILVPTLEPLVTGQEPLEELIDQLEHLSAGHQWTTAVKELQANIQAIDARGIGQDPRVYEQALAHLGVLPAQPNRSRFLQVDMTKEPEAATLGPEVMAELERGARCLWRLAEVSEETELSNFHTAFTERYGDGRLVPLAEALDPDLGIGFGGARMGSEGPLVAGLGMNRRPGNSYQRWDNLCDLLMNKLQDATKEGAGEIEISEEEIDSLPSSDLPRLPDAFQVSARLAAQTPEELASGNFKLLVANLHGPSGARLMGRFCHADRELQSCVESHLRFEESVDPAAVYAEVVHLPEGRVGNILCRPNLRSYEIPILGRSGAHPDHQIPLDDLFVTVVGKSVVLSSKRLGKRVIPRLTSAHNYHHGALGLYKFLGAMQSQGVHQGAPWSWRVFRNLEQLPRVVSGRLVLCRARWRIAGKELVDLARLAGAERFSRVQEWRAQRGLPRHVVLEDSDNELAVDLDNVLSIDAFLGVARRRSVVELMELFPAPEEHAVLCPEGHLAGEFVVPFRCLDRGPSVHLQSVIQHHQTRRSFTAGTEWLYAKLYGGAAAADAVLLEEIAPIVRRAQKSGVIDRWFFLRYSDPERHLRIRFHGSPRELHRELLPELQDAAERLRKRNLIWRFQLDTYDREVERYGGPLGTELSERVAFADSEAVLAALEYLAGDDGADARWRFALLGSELLFRDIGVSYQEQQDQMALMQDSFAKEFGIDRALRSRLAKRFRSRKTELEKLISGGGYQETLLEQAAATLETRSEAMRPLTLALHRAEREGKLTTPLSRINLSYVHMFVNRLIRTSPRVHEAVIYDYLGQLNRSRIAREAQQTQLARAI